MRRATTLVEALVVLALSGVALAGLLALWRGGTRLGRAAEGSSLLTAAMLLQEALTADLRQMGIDPERRDSFLIGDDAISFYRVRFEGLEVKLRPLKWARAPRTGGGFVLVRTERDAAGKLASRPFGLAALSSVHFGLIGDPQFGNRYVRVELVVRDPASGEHPEESAHTVVVHVPMPSGPGNPSLVAAARVVPEADLMPLR